MDGKVFAIFFFFIVVGIPVGMLTARFKLAHLTIGVIALGLQTLGLAAAILLVVDDQFTVRNVATANELRGA